MGYLLAVETLYLHHKNDQEHSMKNIFRFNFKHIKGDFWGGLTSGIVALPLALAFGVSSGLGPSAGLYGAIFISFVAAFFGGTPTQISGPTAPMTAASMVVIASILALHNGELAQALPIILMVFVLAGAIQIGLGGVGMGAFIRYIPYPVVSGFMTAIGVIIIITQILPSLGYYPKEDQEFVTQFKPQAEELILKNILKEEAGGKFLVLEDVKETINRAHEITPESIAKESKTIAANKASAVIGALKVLPRAVKNVNIVELILALSTILIIYGFKKITTAIPSTLVALLVMTAISVFFNLNYRPIEAIPSGLPSFQMGIVANFNLAQATFYIFSAFTLALLGAIDSLLTSVVADNMTKSKHNPNQELVGQGIGNIVAAFFGGIPGAGATIRTVVNIKAGGKTRISGMIAACVLLIVLLVLGPLASKIPAAVLAGILLTVGIGVMDYKGLKAIPHMPKTEVVVMLTVLILSAFWDLIFAVGIGLVIASLMFMKKIGSVIAQRSSVKALDQELIDESGQHSLSVLNNKVFIKQIRGPLFFGYTSDFQEMASQIPSTATTVVIRMENMPYMDQSGLYAMEDVLVDLIENNKKILLVGIIEQPKYMLEQIKIIPDLIPAHQIFGTYPEAIKWLEANITDV